jgi:hypothetical protein
MRKLLIMVIGLLGLASQAVAEPYLAVREGYKCSACHVNMTGGGKRTEFVSAHARQLLHYPDFFPSLSKPVDSFNGELVSPYVAVGANLRTSLTATFQELGNNGRVDNNTAFRGRLEEIEVDLDEAVGYLEVRPIPDVLTFYIDQSFGSQSTTREVWGMLRLPWEFYVKGGKMFLPYGLQLQDDNAFIRGGRNGSVTTGFSFDEQQNAFEVGWEPGPVAAAFAVSDGTSSDKDLQVTGTVSSLFTGVPVVRSVLVGGSFSHVAPPGAETFVWGFFTGFNLGRFTYLGEVDFREDKDKNDGEPSTDEFRGRFIHYSEGNYLFFNWLNLKVAFDYADDDGDLRQRVDDSENRVSVGLEPFWNKFLQTRLFYRVSNGIESNPSHNQDLWSLEVHMFF